MKILILGYGKMGQAIEKMARERNHEIAAVIDQKNTSEFEELSGEAADVAIEFSEPSAAVNNIKGCISKGIPVLSGTTGWLDQFDEIKAFCAEKNGTFFYASNFSVGVNLFFALNEYLATVMDDYKSYQVEMEEIHHIHKKDEPSGTAITLAEGLIKHLHSKNNWSLDGNNTEDVKISAVRQGEVPGTHKITYTSDVDSIEIKHEAFSREGFVKGALDVAEWLPKQKGVLNMKDFLKF